MHSIISINRERLQPPNNRMAKRTRSMITLLLQRSRKINISCSLSSRIPEYNIHSSLYQKQFQPLAEYQSSYPFNELKPPFVNTGWMILARFFETKRKPREAVQYEKQENLIELWRSWPAQYSVARGRVHVYNKRARVAQACAQKETFSRRERVPRQSLLAQ